MVGQKAAGSQLILPSFVGTYGNTVRLVLFFIFIKMSLLCFYIVVFVDTLCHHVMRHNIHYYLYSRDYINSFL